MKKFGAIIALLAVFICAGCEGSPAATSASVSGSDSASSAGNAFDDIDDEDDDDDDDDEDDDADEDSLWDVILDDEDDDDGFWEDDDDDEDEDEDSDDEQEDGIEVTLGTDALISELQTSGQLIHADEYCQIRYFGEMKADNGEVVIVLGYSKFHGGLVRIIRNGFCCGDIVDGGALWFSPMNTFTDGYWCHSGAHGWEFYDDPADTWWADNEFIYLRCPSGGTEVDTEEKAGYAEYATVQGNFLMYDDSVYDGVSKLGLYLYKLQIQEAVQGNYETMEPPYFAEPSNENVHVCDSEYDTKVIRVRFDPDKADIWAHT